MTQILFRRGPLQKWVVAGVIVLLMIPVVWALPWDRMLVGAFGPPAVESREAYEEKPEGPTFDHSLYDGLLKTHVREGGWVDYLGLQHDEDQLDRYLQSIAQASFGDLGRNQKLALLINAYNAFTLKLILENLPLESIQDIPADRRWKNARWQVGPYTWSLEQIEHQQVRAKFREPRIHFALVCAAVGCPPLRAEAYTGDQIEQQLEDQTQYVHHHERWLQFDPKSNRLDLTRLYLWYEGDFEQAAGSVIDYVGRYANSVNDQLKSGGRISVRWLGYDWSLNSRANMP